MRHGLIGARLEASRVTPSTAGTSTPGAAGRAVPVPQPQELGSPDLPVAQRAAAAAEPARRLLFAEADDPGRGAAVDIVGNRQGPGVGAPSTATPSCCSCPTTPYRRHVVTRGAGRMPSRWPPWDRSCWRAWLSQRTSLRRLVACPAAAGCGRHRGDPARGRARHHGPGWSTALSARVRVVAMDPLEENHHALLIRLYRVAGDDGAARSSLRAAVPARDSAVAPGQRVLPWQRAPRRQPATGPHRGAHRGRCGGGRGGAVQAGVETLRTAVRLADRARPHAAAGDLPAGAGEALIHSLRGLDEEGLGALHEGRDRRRPRTTGRGGGGQGRARLRRLPARQLRPGRGLADPGTRVGRDGHRQGDHLSRLGRHRPGRLPARLASC